MIDEGRPHTAEAVRDAVLTANTALSQAGGQAFATIAADTLRTLMDAAVLHPPLAATVAEVARIREMLERILQNPDEPTLPIDDLDDDTVTLARGDVRSILSLLMLGPKSDDEGIVQSDRERACAILEDWGGVQNAQVVSDTMRGLRDRERGFAGDLVRTFRDHRISAPATKPHMTTQEGDDTMGIRTTATIWHAEGVRFDDTQALDEELMDGGATLERLYAEGAATLAGWNGPFIIDGNDEILIADSESDAKVSYGSATQVGTHWTKTVNETIARHLVAGELVFEIMEDGQPAEYLVITPGKFDVREDY
jgi:hypothetical protein